MRIAEVEDALVAKLNAIPDLTGRVAALSDGELNADADVIVTDLPAVRIFFVQGVLSQMHSALALDYDDAQQFTVLCGAQNRRSMQDERNDGLELLDKVVDALAGARLKGLPSIPADANGPQVIVKSRGLFQPPGPAGTWYAIAIEVTGITQYDANAATA